MNQYKYTLTAQNKEGASTTTQGNSKKECLAKFDADHKRTGFIITINDGHGKCTIKSTYR